MQYGISVIVRGDAAGPDTFDKTAERAEADGWDCLWASDHLIMPEMRVSRYPGRADGQLPEEWRRTYYQPFSVLNYLAARTRRVRLGMSVLILPMRSPPEVAAQIAEMDRLSHGRVNFGVGVGWYREEFEALGYSFEDRGERTDDGLAIIKRLWSQEKTSIDGPYYHFQNAETGPKPVQSNLPIYIGGNTNAALRRVGRFGDVWHPFKISPQGISEAKPALLKALDKAGRARTDFPIAPKIPLTFQSDPPREGQAPTEGRSQDIIDSLKRYQDAGATEFCFDIMTETRAVALDTMSRFVQEVRPHL
ncbi:MAG: putative F420-dependent oxidoreductase [Gammaproteobacteria bacterium]|jgi:probable F420-dependent oxidoreductase